MLFVLFVVSPNMYGVKPSFESLLETHVSAALGEPDGGRITKGEEFYAGRLGGLDATEMRKLIRDCDSRGAMASFGVNQFKQRTLSIWRKG